MQARLSVDGKWPGCLELNDFGGGMIFLQDDDSKQQFMVETSVAFSSLPHRPCSSLWSVYF